MFSFGVLINYLNVLMNQAKSSMPQMDGEGKVPLGKFFFFLFFFFLSHYKHFFRRVAIKTLQGTV